MSETTPSSPSERSFLSNLIEKMNPRSCLGIHYHDPQDFDAMVQTILEELKDPNTSTKALERLFYQTDFERQHNRYVVLS